MTNKQAPQLAVVTGASGGIGRAVVRKLIADGFHVLAHYSQNERTAKRLQQEAAHLGGSVFLKRADLYDPEGIQVLVDAVREILNTHRTWRLGALVNNAAKLVGPSFEQATYDQFDDYFALNTRAPFFLTQLLSEQMDAGACIVNVSSAGAHFSSPEDIVYAMSKAAVESLTTNAAEALAPRGIRINAVIPGFTDNGHPVFSNQEVREYMSSFSILGGISDPATVAEAIAFLVSDRAARTTGSLLDVSGGSTLGARPQSDFHLSNIVP